MLKFGVTAKDGKPLLVLGITEANVERLREGKPVLAPAEQVEKLAGTPIHVTITYGKTEQDILDELRAAGIELPPQVDEALARAHRDRTTESTDET